MVTSAAKATFFTMKALATRSDTRKVLRCLDIGPVTAFSSYEAVVRGCSIPGHEKIPPFEIPRNIRTGTGYNGMKQFLERRTIHARLVFYGNLPSGIRLDPSAPTR
jgi:hypothetical protein